MRNNTMNHVSDQASTVKFVPTGTDWPATVTDVQTALSKIGSWANKDNGLPNASRTTKGVMMLCTLEEVNAGTVDDKAVTPKVLKEFQTKPHATKDAYGTTRYANSGEMDALSSIDVSINAAGLSYVFENRGATESRAGALRVATVDQAKQGTQDDRIMTPKKVKAAIDALVPKVGSATESSEGVVKLATTAEIQAGTARNGIAISPYGFANARGTASAYGTFKAATDAQMTSLTGDDAAVTPAALGRNKGAHDKFGVVKLSATHTASPNIALAATADVLYKSGGVMSGHVYISSQVEDNRLATIADTRSQIPVGSTMMWMSSGAPAWPWVIADGRWLNKDQYPALFALYGFHYGGDGGANFAIPDMRGVFPRGCDNGRGVDPNRVIGTVQSHSVGKHQHYSGWGEHPNAHGSYFGRNPRAGYGGSRATDWDNCMFFTNDGSAWEGADPNAGRPGVMQEETRPVNIAVNFIIKIA